MMSWLHHQECEVIFLPTSLTQYEVSYQAALFSQDFIKFNAKIEKLRRMKLPQAKFHNICVPQ